MNSSPQLDLEFVRQQFPAFAEPSLDGWAFFENAGGSYPCRQTVDRLTDFYTHTKVQPYAPYPASTTAGEMMDDAHLRLAGVLNLEADEVHIGPSTSQNTYVLATAFGSEWGEGDEVIVTDQDHEANSGVWRRLAAKGVVIRDWHVDPDSGLLNTDDLTNLLGDRTRLVAFPHCSNIVGHKNPVRQICDLVHEAGAIAVVDGVSAAPHGLPDVDALGADVYLFSAYKSFGPHQGVMTVRRPTMAMLENQSHWFNDGEVHKRLVPAGPDHAQVAALNGIVDYIELVHNHHFADEPAPDEQARRVADLIEAHEAELLTPLLSYLGDRTDVRVLGPIDPAIRVPTVAIAPASEPGPIAAALAEHRVMAGAGDFYAGRLIDAMGIPSDPGVLRVSFVHYTSPAEIDQLIAALGATLG